MISAKKKIVTWASTSLSNLKVFISLRNGTLSGAASFPLPPVRSLQKRPYGRLKGQLTLSLPEWMLESLKVVLTFESVDKILWCDHSNETPLPVLSNGPICFQNFTKRNLGIFVQFCPWAHLALKGLKNHERKVDKGDPELFFFFASHRTPVLSFVWDYIVANARQTKVSFRHRVKGLNQGGQCETKKC